MRLRAGNKLYNGKQVPNNAKILVLENREMYLTGILELGYLIKFIDTDEFKIISKENYLKCL
jgi:hypothetical protein